jgi:hypothetical protein
VVQEDAVSLVRVQLQYEVQGRAQSEYLFISAVTRAADEKNKLYPRARRGSAARAVTLALTLVEWFSFEACRIVVIPKRFVNFLLNTVLAQPRQSCRRCSDGIGPFHQEHYDSVETEPEQIQGLDLWLQSIL